jgi:hypothetical protein
MTSGLICEPESLSALMQNKHIPIPIVFDLALTSLFEIHEAIDFTRGVVSASANVAM